MLGHLAQLGAACGGTARDGLSVLQGDSWPTQALLAVTWQVHECAHPNVNTVVNMAPVCECADPREHVCMRACVSLRLCVCVSEILSVPWQVVCVCGTRRRRWFG